MNADQNEMQRLQMLKALSAGQISDCKTMHVLGIDSVEDLFLLMSKHELPMPRLAPAENADMLRQLNELGVFPFTDGESVSNDHVQNLRHDEGI